MTDPTTDDAQQKLDQMLAMTLIARLALRYPESRSALEARAQALVAQAHQAYQDAGAPGSEQRSGFLVWLIDHPIVIP